MTSPGTRAERRRAAAGTDLTAVVATALATDPDRQVRQALAANVRTPDATLLGLLTDRDFHVRWNAAQNPAASDTVRARALELGGDVAEAVGQLADSLSPALVDAVVAHAQRRVREQAVCVEPAVHSRLAADPEKLVRRQVAAHTTDPDLLAGLAGDRAAEVRFAVAQNLACPRGTVLALAGDRSKVVRWGVMAHRRGDHELSALLKNDPDEDVRVAAGAW
ncbi:hypothetical protein [Cellulomonas sp. SLBN-39]|uniref:hypothetical protein n=1 Tax=Cellulomonas sp. SLBN-39 TaxID=2768446 RepID=UPI001153A287|nr:hypothetical protein [Cellulomonas sp. SLBN-39]TQL02151.1 leucine rich repeat (LRR) protein [Cellulomonas sp. SLBN-39]